MDNHKKKSKKKVRYPSKKPPKTDIEIDAESDHMLSDHGDVIIGDREKKPNNLNQDE